MSKKPIRIEGKLAYIPLSRGLETVIDVADLSLVERRTWWANEDGRGGFYAVTRVWANGKGTLVRMHRVILGVGADELVDHRDGVTLNNRRLNLRPATPLQNQQNCKRPRTSTNKLKGVTRHYGAWAARIRIDGRKVHLGTFPTAEEAHEVYMAAARQAFGEFARAA